MPQLYHKKRQTCYSQDEAVILHVRSLRGLSYVKVGRDPVTHICTFKITMSDIYVVCILSYLSFFQDGGFGVILSLIHI